jgi:hypothetical protein
LLPATDITLELALLGAVGIALLDAKVPVVRTWLKYLAVLPVGALGLFLLSESARLVWHAEASPDSSVVVRNPVPVVMLVLDELPLTSLLTKEAEINEALFPRRRRLSSTLIHGGDGAFSRSRRR